MSNVLSYETLREEFAAQDRKVAGWLLYHDERKAELKKEKEEIRQSCISAVNYSNEAKSKTNKISDVVLDTVIKLDSIQKEKEVQLVEDVMQMLPLEKKVFLELRQKYNQGRGGSRNRHSAYVKIQVKYAEKMAKITGMSEEEVWKEERTLKAWWREILNIAVRLALKRNLL